MEFILCNIIPWIYLIFLRDEYTKYAYTFTYIIRVKYYRLSVYEILKRTIRKQFVVFTV